MLPFFSKHKKLIITIFRILYALCVVYLVAGTYLYLTNEEWIAPLYDWSLTFAHAAVITFILILIPGMLGRFRIRIQSSFILTIFRRQIGIVMFLFAFIHFYFASFLYRVSAEGQLLSPLPLVQLVAVIALFFLFFLFLTSNNLSEKLLGTKWKWLHRSVYIIMWLLFAHTALHEIDIWTVLLGTTAVLETISLIYDWILSKKMSGKGDLVL